MADKPKKQGPNFELKKVSPVAEGGELSEIIPPEPEATRTHDFKELKDNLLALQEHPNEPFEVAHYAARPGSDANPSGAKSIVQRLLLPVGEKKRITTPAVQTEGAFYDIEWRSADYDGSDRDGSVIIAMYAVPTVEAAAE